ncbi:hypothetical protein MUK42_35403 [Musa troglodytarum]|uniref:Uncharacterized protein n=1 Tax=Musa troglodytarum TaxID=320322 RepID=A0A9E7EH26_9LILI|nr:hypothetical protein MUK42_35403 [Musa troglodytarum]
MDNHKQALMSAASLTQQVTCSFLLLRDSRFVIPAVKSKPNLIRIRFYCLFIPDNINGVPFQTSCRSYEPGVPSQAAVDCGEPAMEASPFTVPCGGADQPWVNGLTRGGERDPPRTTWEKQRGAHTGPPTAAALVLIRVSGVPHEQRESVWSSHLLPLRVELSFALSLKSA